MSGMRIELSTDPGSPGSPNEDFAAVALTASGHGGALVVLDGVTPPKGGTGCSHGVPWYVARLGAALLELSVSRLSLTLTRCLGRAIAGTAEEHQGACDLSHPGTPQATAVAARWSDESLEYLVLSDSVLLLDRGERVEAVLDDRLGRLPEHVGEARRAVRALPRGSTERVAAADELRRTVEALRNAEGGFFTAAADPSVAGHAVTGSVPRGEVRAVAALTDGASRLVEVFREADWAGALALLRKEGPEGLIARVRALERGDPEGVAQPRGKAHDDATAVLVEL